MPTTYNPDGSVTYSITLPAGLTVTKQAPAPGNSQGSYTAGGATVAADPAQLNGAGWAEHIAALIAIRDVMQLDYAEQQQAKLDALAGALYAADVTLDEGVPAVTVAALADLPDRAAAAGYRARAAVLDSLGVSLGKAGNEND